MSAATHRAEVPARPATGKQQEGREDGGLVVDQLSWRPHGRRLPTLQQLSLRVAPGERVLLVGASGSGKSTLLRALAGLLDDSLGELGGTVTLAGRPPQDQPGQVGLLLQDPTHSLVADYAGRDAAFGPENLALPRPRVCQAATQALTEVEFPYSAGHPTTQLSGGETQRLALAGALALGPAFLLLDEPTAMLDPDSADAVRAAVRRTVTERALGMIVVEHRLDGWTEICERLVVLGDAGVVIADGPVQQVLTEQREDLLSAGIWVPGAPDPQPVVVQLPPLRPSRPPTSAASVGPALQATAVSVDSPDRHRRLVQALDLELAAGEALALTGASGSGKTTLLRTLIGLRDPAGGEIALRDPAQSPGSDLTPLAEVAAVSQRLAAAVGFLVQHAERMVVRRTVLEEVLATSAVLFADDPDALARARDRAETAIAALGLTHLREADPFQISGGEQRRVALAAVIVHAPALLAADEPTVGQDRQTWAAVQGVLDAARGEGAAVVVSTHDASQIERLGRRLQLDAPVTAPDGADHRLRPVVEPGSPPASRANPLAVIVTGLGAAVGSFFVDTWPVGLIGLALIALLSPLALRRPAALLRLIPVGLAAITVGWSTILFGPGGWWQPERWPVAVREALRICYLVVPGVLLLAAVRPSALADALGQRLHLPHRVVVAAAAGLLRLDGLFAEWRDLGEVRRVRGLAAGRSPAARARQLASMTIALLVSMLRAAQQTAVSMDARGFAAAHRRTYALESPWRWRDWVCVLMGLLLALVPPVTTRLLG